MSHRQSILFQGATIEGTIVSREGLDFFVEEVKPIVGNLNIVRGTECAICQKWFLRKAEFTKHHKVHQHPIHCCVQDCAQKAAEFKDILRHIKTSHPYLFQSSKLQDIVCEVCDEKYTRIDNYKRHLKTVHEITNEPSEFITCTECGRVFSVHARYTKHKLENRCVPPTFDRGDMFIGLESRASADDTSKSSRRSDRARRRGSESQGFSRGSFDPETLDGAVDFQVSNNLQELNDSPEKGRQVVRNDFEQEVPTLNEQIAEGVPAKRQKPTSKQNDKVKRRNYTRTLFQSPPRDENTGMFSLGRVAEEAPRFSSTVLHLPDSTEALLTAVNSNKTEDFSEMGTLTREIKVSVPANTMVKLKINLVVER